ncbi:hypothetical protein Moror_8585 [Moniliophthora roreri MCA 2997]|uniref:Uncharacterized protein n=1 Tax=Moniliophthora roreri (strain MCA 2997) TaxID=1381753 RepID=V2YDC2_MONRO|nr:hypothetical protein Moror_8585 [Moniliophthora roreri MCA 2997]
MSSPSPVLQPSAAMSCPPSTIFNGLLGSSQQPQSNSDQNWKCLHDMEDFAEQTARQVRLKSLEGLKKFIRLSAEQQNVILMSHVLKIEENLKQIDAFKTHAELHIERIIIKVILHPELPAYVSGQKLLAIIMDHLEKHPSWGLTAAVKSNDKKYKSIKDFVGTRATNR